MKNLLGIIVLGLILSSTAFAKCIEGGCINGHGTHMWPGGDKYVGESKDGLENGQGICIQKGKTFIVELKNGKLNSAYEVFHLIVNKKFKGVKEKLIK